MGIILGLLGAGGSILTMPILVYLFGQAPLDAATNSLLIVGSTALVATLPNIYRRQISWRTFFLFTPASLSAVYLTKKVLVPLVPTILFTFGSFQLTKDTAVIILFGLLMIWAARKMLTPTLQSQNKPTSGHLVADTAFRGFFVGSITGIVGAGGGFILIPTLVGKIKLPLRIAIGTSLAMICINSLFGFFLMTSASVQTNLPTLLGMSLTAIASALVAQKFSYLVPETKLKRAFGFFVIVVGGLMLTQQLIYLL